MNSKLYPRVDAAPLSSTKKVVLGTVLNKYLITVEVLIHYLLRLKRQPLPSNQPFTNPTPKPKKLCWLYYYFSPKSTL